MSHAFVKNHIHLVFGTKDRKTTIAKDVQPKLWSYLAGICRNQGMAAIAINGMRTTRMSCFICRPSCALPRPFSSQNEFFQMDE